MVTTLTFDIVHVFNQILSFVLTFDLHHLKTLLAILTWAEGHMVSRKQNQFVHLLAQFLTNQDKVMPQCSSKRS